LLVRRLLDLRFGDLDDDLLLAGAGLLDRHRIAQLGRFLFLLFFFLRFYGLILLLQFRRLFFFSHVATPQRSARVLIMNIEFCKIEG